MKISIIALIAILPVFSSAGEGLDGDNFSRLHQLFQPRSEELKWREIAWHPNLWDARREAARLGKPIYLWEMDGHPLGCV